MNNEDYKVAALVLGAFVSIFAFAWLVLFRTAVDTDQIGYRGVAMESNIFADDAADLAAANIPPEEVYEMEPDDGSSERAYQIYENVQVLGHLSDDNFNRFMAQITEWVAPEEGCAYCHGNDGNFAHDDIYAKVVSRRMIQMTQFINSEWQTHVYGKNAAHPENASAEGPGVNCYTCHRGQNVPSNLWFDDPHTASRMDAFIGATNAGQNHPIAANGYTSLNADPFSAFMLEVNSVQVQDPQPIMDYKPWAKGTQDAEHTYALMMHWSTALGVNCTYCHNSRAFSSWEQSPPARTTAWYGRRMAAAINAEYLDPLQPVYPENRLGPLGDAPKLNCATCHNGAPKPMLGADMVSLYPSLLAAGPANQQSAATWPTMGGAAPSGYTPPGPLQLDEE